MQLNIEKQEKQNLLNAYIDENKQLSTQNQSKIINEKTISQTKKNDKIIIDPIEQLVKNNNILPLLTVIQHVDLNMKIQDKPLLCIMATKFVTLNEVLKNKKNQFTSDSDRRTPLHYAIKANDVKAAAWCIKSGNRNQRDNFGNTPIFDAIRYSYVSLVKLSGFVPVKLVAEMKLLYQDEKYVSLIWLSLLIFLFLYQALYCFALSVMMCLRRKYQQMIHSEKYHHLYDVVKYGDSYISKDKRILQRHGCSIFQMREKLLCIFFY